MKQELFKLIRKHHFNISIYTEDIFERRCQEEIIRSDEDKSSFVYLEFDFSAIEKILKDRETCIQFWEVFLTALNKNNRGSDIIGFLEHESGIGMLLLDSKLDGWNRVKGRIEQKGSVLGFEGIKDILEKTIRPILYPACIQVNDPVTAQPATATA